MGQYETVIGIEVHAQLKTKTKLFCGCAVTFGDKPNTNVCPVCLGLPGALPVLNKRAVELAITAGLAVNCEIKNRSVFARKNYFYPDLPKGYQISQFEFPICEGGYVDFEVEGVPKRVHLERIHMEEDAGKLLHQGAESIEGATSSLVDLNRACSPLIEIVSKPDIRSAQEARAYVEALRMILIHTGVCDGSLEEGSMRADVNISLRPKGQEAFGTRTEVKNINSFRSLERAVYSEEKRQAAVLDAGEKVIQQTRNYDDTKQTTTPLRSKEEAHDYRYFPDPDLMPLVLDPEMVASIKASMVELPADKIKRYQETLGLGQKEATILVEDLELMTYFEAYLALDKGHNAVDVVKWMLGDLSALVNEDKVPFSQNKVSPEHLATLLDLIHSGKISGKMAKEVLATCFKTGDSPAKIVESSGAAQISDTDAIKTLVEQVLAENQDAVEKVKSGKTNVMGFLVGQVMKASKGQANPGMVKPIIEDLLK